ncbi:MAG: M28 family peptidase [Bacteroidota bacterium]
MRIITNIGVVILNLLPLFSMGQNVLPSFSNLRITHHQRDKAVQFTYDLADPDDSLIHISLLVRNARSPFMIPDGELKGDVGAQVAGTGKSILWNYGDYFVEGLCVRLIADDFHSQQNETITVHADTVAIKENMKRWEGERNHFSPEAERKRRQVQADLVDYFKQLALSCYVQDTVLPNFEAKKGTRFDLPIENIIAEIPGADPSLHPLVLLTHYDTDTATTDPAAGLAAIAETARILSSHRFARTIRFVIVDLGKSGYLGSRFYAIRGMAELEMLAGVINLDVAGHYSNALYSQTIPDGFEELFEQEVNTIRLNQYRGDFVALSSNTQGRALSGIFEAVANRNVPELKIISLPGSTPSRDRALRVSDHAIFWRLGHPTISISDTGDLRTTPPEGSTNTDSKFLAQIIKATTLMIAKLGEIKHCTVLDFALKSQ